MTKQNEITEPRTLSGFHEFSDKEQLVYARCYDITRRHYELAGATPLETSAFEEKRILVSNGGNGGVDRQIYSVSRLAEEGTDKERTDYALRFDQTVPLARFVAMRKTELSFPYRRYQMQPVWRGERAQSGRYREFTQADIDVIGDGKLALITDAELPAIIYGIFTEMGIGEFLIRISNRKLLDGVLTAFKLDETQRPVAMRTLDKLDKIGGTAMQEELISKVNLEVETAAKLHELACTKGTIEEITPYISSLPSNTLLDEGLDELTSVCNAISMLGVPTKSFTVDLSVARGLSYYTGTVYETTLLAHPGIGSICSGGRYEDLANKFTKHKLPGVGISIGLTRLVARLLEAGILTADRATTASVLITSMNHQIMPRYLDLATRLRKAGICTEVYLEPNRIGEQLRFASRKGFNYAVIAGEAETTNNTWKIKDLFTGVQQSITDNRIVSELSNNGNKNQETTVLTA